MLYKVSGAGHSVCVCVCVGGGQSSVVRGVKEGRGGKVRREFSFLTAWWMKLSFSLLVLAWRIRSLLPDGSRLKKLCVGWVGSPAMQRALRVSCREGRERHQQSSQLLSLSVGGSCGRTRCRRHTTQWCSWSGCSRWCLCRRCTWWRPGLWLFWVCGGSRDAAVLSWPVLQCC